MSVWFRSYITYGVIVDYDTFKRLGGEKIWDDDSLMMDNAEDGIGWETGDGDYAIFGKLVLNGTDNGNDTPLGGDGNAIKLPLLSTKDKKAVRERIKQEMGDQYAKDATYYVVGDYS